MTKIFSIFLGFVHKSELLSIIQDMRAAFKKLYIKFSWRYNLVLFIYYHNSILLFKPKGDLTDVFKFSPWIYFQFSLKVFLNFKLISISVFYDVLTIGMKKYCWTHCAYVVHISFYCQWNLIQIWLYRNCDL